MNDTIVFYDGICGFCDSFVQFILDNKPKKGLKFVSFQSEMGKKIIKENNLEIDYKSIIVIKDGKVFQKSKAIFLIFNHVDSGLKYLHFFTYIPSMFSDFFYNLISKHRYKIKGKITTCRLLTNKEKEFFI